MLDANTFTQTVDVIQELLDDTSISSTYIASHLEVETSTVNRYRQGKYLLENMSMRMGFDLFTLATRVLPANQLLDKYEILLKETTNFKGVKLAFDKAEKGYFFITYDEDTRRVEGTCAEEIDDFDEEDKIIVDKIDLEEKPILMTLDIKYRLTKIFEERNLS